MEEKTMDDRTSPQAGDYRERIYAEYRRASDRTPATEAAGFLSRAPYLRAVIRKHLPEDRSASMLDLGCGTGALLYFVREAGYMNVAGVDRSPQQVAEAARLGIPGVTEGDLLETLRALPEASQDAVLAFDVIEHFTREELLALVDEVHRVLKPGGRWVIHTVNAEAPFFGRIRYGDLTHEMAFTTRSLAQLMLASGFRSVSSFEDVPTVHGVKSAVRHLAWRAIRLACRVYLAAETGETGRGAVFSQNFLAVVMK